MTHRRQCGISSLQIESISGQSPSYSNTGSRDSPHIPTGLAKDGSCRRWARMYDIDKWVVCVELDEESYVSGLAGPCKSSNAMTSCGHYRRSILSAVGSQEMAEKQAHFRDGQPIAARGFTKDVSDIGPQPVDSRSNYRIRSIIPHSLQGLPTLPRIIWGSIPTPQHLDALPPPFARGRVLTRGCEPEFDDVLCLVLEIL